MNEATQEVSFDKWLWLQPVSLEWRHYTLMAFPWNQCTLLRETNSLKLSLKIEEKRLKNKRFLNIFFIFVPLSDDAGAVYPCGAAQPTSPAGGISVRRPGLPSSGNLRLEEEMLILFHSPPPRHHDRQLGSYNLDPQSHELHSGKRRACLCHKNARMLYGLC